MSRRWKGALLPLLLLAAWQWESQRGAVYAAMFPSLQQIGAAALELWRSKELQGAIEASLARACIGLVIGGAAGIAGGLLMALSRPVDSLLGPIVHALRQVPLFAWIPLIGVWLGSGEASRLFVVELSAFFPCLLNAYEVVANVDRRYLEVAQVLRLPLATRVRRLALPAALPGILTGLSHAVALAWIAAVASELLFASGPGLGNSMLMAEAGARMDVVLLCTAVIGLLGHAMNSITARLGQRLLRWRDVENGS